MRKLHKALKEMETAEGRLMRAMELGQPIYHNDPLLSTLAGAEEAVSDALRERSERIWNQAVTAETD